jgi:hypothetical protein
MLCFIVKPMAALLWWIGFGNSWKATSGLGRTAALALSFWPSLAMNSDGRRQIICGMAFMNYAPNKGTSNIGCSIFFHGRQVAILAHALTKEDEVPKADFERATRRKKMFEANPKAHTYESKE